MPKYVYPAILAPDEEGGYFVKFPDIDNCYTEGQNLSEALEMAQDVLTLILCSFEDNEEIIPEPSQ